MLRLKENVGGNVVKVVSGVYFFSRFGSGGSMRGWWFKGVDGVEGKVYRSINLSTLKDWKERVYADRVLKI